MAIDLGTESIKLSVKERTWRVEIFTDFGTDPIIRAHREKVWLRDDGSCFQREVLPVVERRLSEVAKQDFDGMTGLQLAERIAAISDTLRQEDLAAAAAESKAQDS